MPPSNPRPSHAPPSSVRLFLWLWILLAWGPLAGRAQNLVTNGHFNGGQFTGWQGNPGYIGYVPSQGSAWIGLSGELYQDLVTEPGASYTIEFSVQRFDPTQTWRPNSLDVSWDNQRVARFDFVESDIRWLRPRFTVRSTGTVTRLRFRGTEFPSLDDVSVTRILPAFTTGSLELPLEGSQWLEGQSIPLRCLWTSLDGAGIPATTTFLLGGITPIATASRVGSTADAVWTNVPAGVHFLSASTPDGYQTSPVRIEVAVQPKFREVRPLNRQVFVGRTPVRLGLVIADNTGTNAIRAVRIVIDGEEFARILPTANRIQSIWTATTEGTHTIEFVGETADGRDMVRSNVLVDVVQVAQRDIVQEAGGAAQDFGTTSRVAQTFIAGTDGRLVAVELVGGSNSANFNHSFRIDILDVDPVSLKPGTNTLGSTQLTLQEAYNASSSGMLHFAFLSNQVQLVAGRSYAIACRLVAPAGSEANLRSSVVDALPGGQIWRRSGTDWVPGTFGGSSTIGHDLQMTTWMVPIPPPSVTILAPIPLTTFAAGESIPMHVGVTTNTSSSVLERVAFLANGVELGSLAAPPYTFTWTNPPAGNHILQATAIDSIGRIGWSQSVSILSGVDAAQLPRLHVADAVSPEGNSSLPPLVFPVTLSAPALDPITVEFSTRNLSAVAGVDFLASSGMLTFAPGQTQAFVFVRMVGDSRDEPSRSLRLELRFPVGALLERPSAMGTILDDERGAGKPDRYEWADIPQTLRPGTPFLPRLTARDPSGATVDSVPGEVRISLIQEAGLPRLFMGPVEPTGTTPEFGFTASHRLRPKTDVIVTHLRTRGGVKAALWNDQQQVEATATFPFDAGVWQEVALPHPVLLKAGLFYHLTLLVVSPNIPTGALGYAGTDVIESWSQAFIPGDAFPTIPMALNVPVDFRFVAVEERPELLPAIVATDFPSGTWKHPLSITASGPRLRLLARDLLGKVGVSDRLTFAAPAMDIATDPSVSGPAFLINAPAGYRFQIQTSTNLETWIDSGPTIISSGVPIPWQATPPLPAVEFLRLITVD